jgi:hypothetical protein
MWDAILCWGRNFTKGKAPSTYPICYSSILSISDPTDFQHVPTHDAVAVQVSPYAQLASVNGLHDQQSWSQGPKGYSFFETPWTLLTLNEMNLQ